MRLLARHVLASGGKGSAWLRELEDTDTRTPDFSEYLRSLMPAPRPPVEKVLLVSESARSIYDEEEESITHIPDEDLVIDGLIAHWPMDQSSGTYIPDIVSGTYPGATEGSPAWGVGIAGNALVLNGTNQLAQFRNEPNLIGPDHSYLIWLRPSSVTGQRGIISKISNITGQGLLIEQSGTTLRAYLDGTTPKLIRPNVFVLNTWIHIAVVLDMGTLRLYLDGVPDATASYTSVTNWDGGAFLIGRQNNLNRFFAGSVDDVRVYEVPLAAEDVADIYVNT